MSHIVIYRSPDGQAVYHQAEALEEAARHVEWLRNSGQGKDARIFKMQEVPIEVKTYYRVEVSVADDSAPGPAAPSRLERAAPSPAPGASSTPAPAAAPAPAPAPAQAAPGAAPSASKPEPANASANGGRFGLFGKG